jgi:hypothetical protein
MTSLLALPEGINPTDIYYLIDKVTLRTKRALTGEQRRFLRENCGRLDIRNGRYIPQRIDQVLTLYQPNLHALSFLAEQGADFTVNDVEIKLEIILPDERTKLRVRDLFDRHFVQPWHGKYSFRIETGGTYTKDFARSTRRRRPGHGVARPV